MKIEDEVFEIKQRLATQFFEDRCYICHKKFARRPTFVIHHTVYKKGHKTYKDFTSKVDYYKYLSDEVLADPLRDDGTPENFLLLCNKHHGALHRLNRWSEANRERLIDAVRRTKVAN